MKNILASFIFIFLIYMFFKNEKHNQVVLQKFDQELSARPLVANFSDKEETENNLEDSCIQFEGSKISLENPRNYNNNTQFVALEKDGCIRKITANGEVFLTPEYGENCVNFRLPKSYCVGKGCVRKIDHCF